MARILHVIPGLTGGGAERQLALLAGVQATSGHEVHIAMIRPELPAAIADSNVHVHVLHAASNSDPLLFWRVRSLIRATNTAVVQTWLTLSDVVGGLAALQSKRPWILSERSEAAAYPPNWKFSARARLARRASAIVANSEGGVRYWRSQGVAANRIVEIPNAVVQPAHNLSIDPLPASIDGRPFVLYVGRLSQEKSPLVLIDALAMAFSSSNAAALLCGLGPLETEMTNRIQLRNAGDRIVLAGHRKDVPGLMQKAALCVAISQFEGSPNVVLEAMAAGCPLVVSDIPAYRQLLDDTSALFVPLNDVRATANAISEVLSNPEAAAERAAQARARIPAFTPENVAAQLDRLYAQLT